MIKSYRCMCKHVTLAGHVSKTLPRVAGVELCFLCEKRFGTGSTPAFVSSYCFSAAKTAPPQTTLTAKDSATAPSFNFQRCFLSTKVRTRTHFYDLLGVSPKATQSEIKTAYYKLSKKHHPDINKTDAAKGMFTQISEAYETLGNRQRREMYDQGINSSRSNPGGGGDYTQPFREREGFGSVRREAPTGRTKHYNFDEFYRQHYSESFQKEKVDREYWRLRQEEIDVENQQNRLRMIVTGAVVGAALVAMLLVDQVPVQRNQREKKDR